MGPDGKYGTSAVARADTRSTRLQPTSPASRPGQIAVEQSTHNLHSSFVIPSLVLDKHRSGECLPRMSRGMLGRVKQQANHV
jgi:hypothetical protein